MAGNLTHEQQAMYLQQVQAEVQQQMLQDLVSKMSETCFKKCTGRSGVTLDSREQNCMALCVDR